MPVLYAGPQDPWLASTSCREYLTWSGTSLVGLDRVNVFLPPSLQGTGTVDIAVSIDGEWSNPLRIAFK